MIGRGSTTAERRDELLRVARFGEVVGCTYALARVTPPAPLLVALVGLLGVLGQLADRARGVGQTPGLAALAIAATAQSHGYTILTRNLRHFSILGVTAINPFENLPAKVA